MTCSVQTNLSTIYPSGRSNYYMAENPFIVFYDIIGVIMLL